MILNCKRKLKFICDQSANYAKAGSAMTNFGVRLWPNHFYHSMFYAVLLALVGTQWNRRS